MDYESYKELVLGQIVIFSGRPRELIQLDDAWLRPVYDDLRNGKHRMNEGVVAQKWIEESSKAPEMKPPVIQGGNLTTPPTGLPK